MKTFVTALFAVSTLAGAAHANTHEPHNVYGTFLTEDQTAHIQVSDCGDATPCGRVIWFDAAQLPEGETMEDYVGQDGEKVIGSLILHSFEKKKKGWRGGKIYEEKSGKTYGSKIQREEDGTLKVKGCLGPICQSQIWTPVKN